MSILGKVKELGEEIVKTVEETGIKDNVKYATMIIKDTVEKGKKELESKIEENKRKIEEEKQRLAVLGENIEEEITNQFQEGVEVIEIDKVLEIANTFNEKLCVISSSLNDKKVTFGNGCEEKVITKILANWDNVDENSGENVDKTAEVEMIEEVVLKVVDNTFAEEELKSEEKFVLCYNGKHKGTLLLSNENFYIKSIHPVENMLYSVKIPTEKIQDISIIKEDNKNILTINRVQVGVVDSNATVLLNKYFTKITEKKYEILISDIIEEIKKVRFVESQVVVQIINDLIEK